MKQITYFSEKPEKMHFEQHNGEMNRVWLRKNIAEYVRSDGEHETTEFTADEVYFETSASKDEIEADFDGWFDFGKSWVDGSDEQSTEERLTNLENAVLALMGI